MTVRAAEIRRTTKETDLFVRVVIDGRGESKVKTGIGFFDHMLDAFARHGLFDLTVEAQGDLHVDGHHTVEDTGIAVGTAIARALGDRAGIRRYGDALVPLDDALVRAVVDVSGRPYLHYDIEIAKWQMLGDYDVFLTPEFFRAVVLNAGLTAHLDLVRGDNPHHIVEAAFKSFARALDAATVVDPRVVGRAVHEGKSVIAVVDYGVNNLKSVVRALEAGGHTATLSTDPDAVRTADRVLVPGVGNFGQGSRNLTTTGLGDAVREVAAAGRPVMGICLGLQLLFETSEEAADATGIGLLPGRVRRFTTTLHVPHVGWARVDLTDAGRRHAMLGPLFNGEPRFFYHVHSYLPERASGEMPCSAPESTTPSFPRWSARAV